MTAMLSRCQRREEPPLADCSAEVMGLTFRNRLGLAAGLDRNGGGLAFHGATGVGHIEIGTVADPRQVSSLVRVHAAGLVVGINFASVRNGLDLEVIDDYARLLRELWPLADFLVANLSAPSANRGGDTPGIEALLARLSIERQSAIRETGLVRPLLIKVRAGACGTALPQWVGALRSCDIQGVVLVSSFPERIAECRPELGDMTLISVGGIATSRDAEARLDAGASLVQFYSSYAAEGQAAVHAILNPRAATESGR